MKLQMLGKKLSFTKKGFKHADKINKNYRARKYIGLETEIDFNLGKLGLEQIFVYNNFK
ncbi:hypothetical protein [Paenibacillus sp. KN14-4R]|uniref:hypothetical protein n=1 Tax=Paenibacillus sp. KN14-4R TaxID=3445773 RepID=UPI003FA06CBE